MGIHCMGHDLEELSWPSQIHDLSPTEQIFNETEHRLRAWPSYPTTSDLINALLAELGGGLLVKNSLMSVVFRIQEQQWVQGVLTSHFWVNKNE